MAVYLVSYHLMMENQDYRRLFDALHAVPHHHALQSVWFVEHPGDSAAICDWLAPLLDSNDRLFVSRVTPDWAEANIGRHADWLSRQVV